jgi:hypothetical protein
MGEADSYESKRRIDLTLNVLIEQVKEMVTPDALQTERNSEMFVLDHSFCIYHHCPNSSTM